MIAQEKYFELFVWMFVIVVHVFLLGVFNQTRTSKIHFGSPAMTLVDLGYLSAAALPVEPEVVAPTPPKPVVKPKPKPKPKKVKPKPKKIIASRSKKKPADWVEKIEKEEVVEQVPENPNMQAQAEEKSDASERSGPIAKTPGDGKESFTEATHMGGHLYNPKPPYPNFSRENGEEGSVRLTVVVEPDGRPSSVKVSRSSGYPRLDRSAKNTVEKRYRFIPATRGGVPIRSSYTFNVVFRLD